MAPTTVATVPRRARAARPGDRLYVMGPNGAYAPNPEADWHLLVGDEAAQQRLGIREIPVSRKSRYAGESKVSGNLYGSYMAGRRILGYVFRAFAEDRCSRGSLGTLFGAKTPRRATSETSKTE